MLAKLDGVVAEATAAFDGFDYARAWSAPRSSSGGSATTTSSWSRAGRTAPAAAGGVGAAALRRALDVLQRLLAPTLPFAAEEAWSWWHDEQRPRRAAGPSRRRTARTVDLDAISEVLASVRRSRRPRPRSASGRPSPASTSAARRTGSAASRRPRDDLVEALSVECADDRRRRTHRRRPRWSSTGPPAPGRRAASPAGSRSALWLMRRATAHGAPGPSVSPSSPRSRRRSSASSSPPGWSAATSSSANATSSTSGPAEVAAAGRVGRAAGGAPDADRRPRRRRPRSRSSHRRGRRRRRPRARCRRRRRRPCTARAPTTAPPATFPPADPDGENFLITGADNGACIDPDSPYAGAFGDREGMGERSDTIMVLRVDPAATGSPCCRSPATSTSTSPAPGNRSRINSAYRRDDPQRLIDTIYENFGVGSTTTSRSTSAPSRRSSTPSAASPCRSSSRRRRQHRAQRPDDGVLRVRRRARPRLRAVPPLPVRGPARERQLAGGPVERPRARLAAAGLHPPDAVEHPRPRVRSTRVSPRPDPRPRPSTSSPTATCRRRSCSSSPA